VKHEKEPALHLEDDALAEAVQAGDDTAAYGVERRIDRA